MATAQDYKVTFPYGATSWPYSASRPHRGNDRACPTGTAIVIAGVTIGHTGNTGDTTGPHLHTQAGTDIGCQNTFNPGPLEFKPGKVVRTRTTDPNTSGSWGKFITIQVGSQFITYAHLNSVNVAVGQVINPSNPPSGGDNMDYKFQNEGEVKRFYFLLRGDEATLPERQGWVGKTIRQFLDAGNTTVEVNNRTTRTKQLEADNATLHTQKNGLATEVEALKKKLAETPQPGTGKPLSEYKLGELIKELGL